MNELLNSLHRPSVVAIVALSLLLVLDFVVGSQRNMQLATRFREWARSAFPNSEGKWEKAKSSGFQAVVTKPPSPFRSIFIQVAMLPREVLPLWVLYVFQRKEDLLLVEATLKKPLRTEVEIVREKSRLGKRILSKLKGNWEKEEMKDGLSVLKNGRTSHQSVVRALSRFVSNHPGAVQRISFRKESPHVLVVVAVDRLGAKGVDGLFRSLEDLGKVLV